ncbi:fatty acyl-CoA reductase wat-like [Megalopta genalis]|uniref:fatty acyl-CoA reductase wat-like n=1 Tax=Megalopta genalis TaxID=115081 RepID=UPI003FD40378
MSSGRSEELISQVPGNNGSEIVEFYKGTKVLVTGGTGFLGLLIIEKLLRSCPDIVTIYMLIRQKKGKSVEERIKQYFNDTVFSRLKQEQPDFLNKIVVIEGDAAEENFGLSAQSILTLSDTNIVIHAAAIVKFNEKLRTIVHTNVRTTKQLLLWAKTLPNLKSFVYVSTAFSNCVHETIDEIHYDPPMDCDKLMTLVDCLDDDKLLAIEATLRGKWPNNYIYSKSTAENVVLKYAGDLPVGIVRPSIVTATFHEPLEGWINNINGVTGILVGGAIGLLHTLHCLPEYASEIIPADYVVSNTIAASWDINKRNVSAKLEKKSDLPDEDRVPIYNQVTSPQNRLEWSSFMYLSKNHGDSIPTTRTIWFYWFILNRYLFIHNIYSILFHIIPATIADTLARLAGHKPMLLDAYAKVDKFSDVISFFSTRQWKFRDENVKKLWSKLGPIDRKIFNFNVADIYWPEYFDVYVTGIRVYLLKDPLTEESLRAGRSKFWKLRIANYVVMTLYALLGLWIVYSLVSLVWSFCPLSH